MGDRNFFINKYNNDINENIDDGFWLLFSYLLISYDTSQAVVYQSRYATMYFRTG